MQTKWTFSAAPTTISASIPTGIPLMDASGEVYVLVNTSLGLIPPPPSGFLWITTLTTPTNNTGGDAPGTIKLIPIGYSVVVGTPEQSITL